MQALAFSGIPSGDTYTLIKAISKKKEKVIMKYEEQFLTGFMEHGNCDRETAEKVWKIIQDSARYGFCNKFM